MTYPDAVERITDLTLEYLLKDSDEAGVRLFRQDCEDCNADGVIHNHEGDTILGPCPICSGRGYVVRVAVLEIYGRREARPDERDYEEYDIYRDRPTKEAP